jgi:hypothetical protein
MTRTAATAKQRTTKPQQQTLYVRINDALRRRLERARHLRASITGTYVSTSGLMRRAWDIPDIRTTWDAFAREYGEL